MRLARVEAGLTQKHLAFLIYSSQYRISQIERGKSVPNALMLQAIAEATGKHLEYFRVKQKPRKNPVRL